jgi:hypothetical protein
MAKMFQGFRVSEKNVSGFQKKTFQGFRKKRFRVSEFQGFRVGCL